MSDTQLMPVGGGQIAAAVDEVLPAKPMDVRARIAAQSETVLSEASAFIVTDANLEAAHAVLVRIQRLRDEWAEFMDPHIERAMEVKRLAEANRKALVDDKNLRDGPLLKAREDLSARVVVVQEAAEQKRLAALAAQQAVEEQKAVEARLAAALVMEEDALTAPSREEAEAIAAELDAFLEEPVDTPAAYVPPVVSKGTGVSLPVSWSAAMTNLEQLLRAFVEKKLDKPLEDDLRIRLLKILPTPMMNKRASSLQTTFSIPGVKAVRRVGTQIRT